MKKLIGAMKLLSLLLLAAISFILSSHSPMPGGEGFEVYQNEQLILRQFGNDMNKIKSIQLTAAGAKEQITVKYFHCGRIAKNRHIVLRSRDKKELKNWLFSGDPGMSFRVADVLVPGKRAEIDVYYSSSELPAGRLLVSLIVNG